MWARVALVTLLVACHAPAAPSKPTTTTTSTTKPGATVSSAPIIREACATGVAVPEKARTKTFDFTEDNLDALPFGPRAKDIPVSSRPRNLATLERATKPYALALVGCYRWAKFVRPTLATDLVVTFAIDEYGVATAVTTATPADSPAVDLAGCVTDVMADLHAGGLAPRRTTFELPITFAPSGQRAPTVRPDRAEKVTPARASGCVRTLRPVPVDRLGPVAKLVIDDFSVAQQHADDEAEYQRQQAECKRSKKRCFVRSQKIVDYLLPAPATTTSLDKSTIRAGIRANRGVLRACHRDALARRADVTGVVTFEITIDQDRLPVVRIESSTTNDAVLDGCMRDAVAEARFPRTDPEHVVAHYPIALVPNPPAPAPVAAGASPDVLERAGDELVAYGDGEAAFRRFSAIVDRLPLDARACRWRAGELRALLVAAPWIDDRAIRVARELVADVVNYPTACLATAEPALLAIVEPLFKHVDRFRSAEMLDEAEARLALFDASPELLALPSVVSLHDELVRLRRVVN